MYNDNKKYGYDFSNLQNNITSWGNSNPLSTSDQAILREYMNSKTQQPKKKSDRVTCRNLSK